MLTCPHQYETQGPASLSSVTFCVPCHLTRVQVLGLCQDHKAESGPMGACPQFGDGQRVHPPVWCPGSGEPLISVPAFGVKIHSVKPEGVCRGAEVSGGSVCGMTRFLSTWGAGEGGSPFSSVWEGDDCRLVAGSSSRPVRPVILVYPGLLSPVIQFCTLPPFPSPSLPCPSSLGLRTLPPFPRVGEETGPFQDAPHSAETSMYTRRVEA
jgi:hypothetical protein